MPSCDGSRPMGRPGASAGLQTRRPGLAKVCPVARPNFGSSVRDGSFAPRGWQTQEQGSPVCSTWDQRHLSGARRLPNRGVRERPMQCRLPRNSGRREPTVAITARNDPAKNTVSASLRVQAERLGLTESDCKAVKHLSTQIVRKTGESNFHFERRFTLRVVPSSTLSNSTNGWRGWQRRI